MTSENLELTGATETMAEVMETSPQVETYHPLRKLRRYLLEHFPHPIVAGAIGAGIFKAATVYIFNGSEEQGTVLGFIGFAAGFITGCMTECSPRSTAYPSDD